MLPNTGANSGSYCHTFHHIRPILRRGSNSGLNSQFVAQRERIQKSDVGKNPGIVCSTMAKCYLKAIALL